MWEVKKKKKQTQGCWPQVAEMNIKGMTNNPRHCISPYVAIIVQFKSCLILCNPTDGSTLGFPILNYLPKFSQTHVHWVRCHLIISSCVTFFSSCPQSFPASGSFPMSQLFTSSGQRIGASVSASVLLMNIQGWFPLWLTSLSSLQSKGFSTVFSSTTVQRHHFFGTQPSLWSNSHIHTWLLERP